MKQLLAILLIAAIAATLLPISVEASQTGIQLVADGVLEAGSIRNLHVWKDPSRTPMLSICFSPYVDGLNPEYESPVSMDEIRRQLDLIRPYADTIRLFGVSGELAKAYKIAKEEYDFRIIGGCWIDGRYSEAGIRSELDALIEMCNSGYVDIAVVGSETIYRNDFTVGTLIEYIEYVRSGITNKSIPVTTSDTASSFFGNPTLGAACDTILVTIYPFFEHVPIENAVQSIKDTYDAIKSLAGDKPVIVSETGWPAGSDNSEQQYASDENARIYVNGVYEWSRKGTEVIFFSSIDEQWKHEPTVYGDVGKNWGHFTSDGKLKPAFHEIYQYIAAMDRK